MTICTPEEARLKIIREIESGKIKPDLDNQPAQWVKLASIRTKKGGVNTPETLKGDDLAGGTDHPDPTLRTVGSS